MKIETLTSQNIAMLAAIAIGGLVAIINPDYMETAFNKTIIAVILVKVFWK